MPAYTEIIDNLIKGLTKLPGIGPKSAERIIFHILKNDEIYARGLSKAITDVKERIFFCETCFNLSAEKACHICSDPVRNQKVICVVEEPKDVIAFEKAGGYDGVYHVLLGVISPIDGVGPSNLKIAELLERVKSDPADEIILATNPSADGDATATYLIKQLSHKNIKLSRISKGVPIGSNFDYIDQATLACALRDRRQVSIANE